MSNDLCLALKAACTKDEFDTLFESAETSTGAPWLAHIRIAEKVHTVAQAMTLTTDEVIELISKRGSLKGILA